MLRLLFQLVQQLFELFKQVLELLIYIYSECSATPSQTYGSRQLSDPVDDPNHDLKEFIRAIVALCQWRNAIFNTKALATRFFRLMRKPEDLASPIRDVCSLSVSFLFTSSRRSGVDFLYPMSSLKKWQSGRLARLILEHSRESRDIEQHNIHGATFSREDIDYPRVAVIDLEVSRDIIGRGYSVPADIHGYLIACMMFQVLIALLVTILASPVAPPHDDLTGPWLDRWLAYLFGPALGVTIIWYLVFVSVAWLCAYAILRGDGVLALLHRSSSGPPVPGFALFLDRRFTVILTGDQNIVEAIAESSLSISHVVSWSIHQKGLRVVQFLCYELLKALCEGVPLALFLGSWFLVHPPSRLVPVVAVAIISLLPFRGIMDHLQEPRVTIESTIKRYYQMLARCGGRITPFICLIAIYGLTNAKQWESVFKVLSNYTLFLHLIPMLPVLLLLVSSRDYPARTPKLLDVLRNPPVRKWEFDTLAAAATFQCLVLCCRDPRPTKTIDVLDLLDILIPDQTDQTEVWTVWKKRVADRIMHKVEVSFAPILPSSSDQRQRRRRVTHEMKISFTPTLPSFGDQRQERLKDLLDQAQLGYDAYSDSYDRPVPLYPP